MAKPRPILLSICDRMDVIIQGSRMPIELYGKKIVCVALRIEYILFEIPYYQ